MSITQFDLIRGYSLWVSDLIAEGFEPTQITIMFNKLRGPFGNRRDVMRQDIERLYGYILPRIVRHHRSKPTSALPQWMIFPDLPVYKRERGLLSDITVNGGLHWNGIAFQPPNSRLTVTFAQHLMANDARYRHNTQIARIHAQDVDRTPERLTDYVMKSVTRAAKAKAEFAHRTSSIIRFSDLTTDDIIILPRLHREVRSTPLLTRPARFTT